MASRLEFFLCTFCNMSFERVLESANVGFRLKDQIQFYKQTNKAMAFKRIRQ